MAKTTNHEVVSAAQELFRDLGYSGFSVGMLAKRVGVRKASLYSRFSGKDEIACAALELAKNEIKSLETEEGPWHERYRDFVSALAEYMITTKRCLGLHMSYGAVSVEVNESIKAFFIGILEILSGILEEVFPPEKAKSMSEDCLGDLEGATLWLVLNDDPAPIRRVVEKNVTLAKQMATVFSDV